MNPLSPNKALSLAGIPKLFRPTRGRVLLVLVALLLAAVASGSESSASALRKFIRGGAHASSPQSPHTSPGAYANKAPSEIINTAAHGAPKYMPLLAPALQLGPEDIGAFESDCATPKTDFEAGDTVCAKVDGTIPGSRQVYWISPDGFVLQTDIVSTTSRTATRVVSQRGDWRLYLVGLDGGLMDRGFFSVSDAQNPSANLSVVNTIDRRISSFAEGHTIRYLVTVTNNGPDAASDVVLTMPAPNDTTYDSSDQESGPAFNCAESGGNSTCTIATLNAGDAAEFSFTYTVNSGTPKETALVNTATVASDTEELHEGDNSSTAEAAVTGEVTDTECVLECPNDMVVTADTTDNGQPDGTRGAYVNFSAAEPFGQCGALSTSQASGSFFPVGQNTVTVSSAEGGGGCSFTVHVIDTPPPGITCPPDKAGVAATGELEASVEVGTPTTTGPVQSVTGVRSDGLTRPLTDPYPIGTTIITWTARDAAPDADGIFPPFTRSASCQQRVVVTSNDAPTISCPADQTFDAPGGACEMTLTTAQIGSPTATPSGGVTVVSARDDGLPLSAPFPAGDTFITWTAEDANGRRASCIQKITVRGAGGSTGPVLNVPPDVEVFTNSCSALVDERLGVATATSACGGSVNITRTGIPTVTINIGPITITRPTFVFPVGTTVITYTATDSAGQTTTGTQNVVVKESSVTPPSVTAPPDVVMHTGAGAASCGVVIGDAALGTATASDNCPAGATVARTGVPAGNFFPVGETIVTYTATDASGYTATDTQKVTVIDNTAPTITAPADVTLYTGAGATSCDVTVANLDAALGTATVGDNCPGATGARDNISNVFPLGQTVVTYTATDAHGNTATDTQTVTVVDNTPPVVVPPPDITVYLPLNSTATSMAVNYPTPATATDNCAGTISFVYSPASGSVFPVGPTTVTVTATDAHNNSASATFTVTVLYNFTGFFSPVSNPPVVNNVNAGRSLPLKFSLSGNKGLGIFAAGYPASQQVVCNSSAPLSDLEGTETPGGSTLTYSPDQYHYNWKTENSWAGTCRVLVVKLNDGSEHTALFKFK